MSSSQGHSVYQILFALQDVQRELSAVNAQLLKRKNEVERLEMAVKSKTMEREKILEQLGEVAPEIGTLIDTKKMLRELPAPAEGEATAIADSHDPRNAFGEKS